MTTDATSVVEAVLEELYKRRGELRPVDLVEEATDPDHALHDRFEWDDRRAAHEYRLDQAAQLIRSVRVRFIVGDEEVRVNRYHAGRDTGVSDPGSGVEFVDVWWDDPLPDRMFAAIASGDLP